MVRASGEGRSRLCDDCGDVTPDIKLAVGVSSRYLDAGVFEALPERFSESDILARRYQSWRYEAMNT